MKDVYGTEARWDQLFLNNIKSALKIIADATDQLNSNFDLTINGNMSGISRLSAYLHLLHHQVRSLHVALYSKPLKCVSALSSLQGHCFSDFWR